VQTKAGYTSFLANNPGTYNLNSWNCTNVAVFVGNYGDSLGISTAIVSTNVQRTYYGRTIQFNFSGICPGQLGFELWNDPDAVKNIMSKLPSIIYSRALLGTSN
jgi:hypothetical protein